MKKILAFALALVFSFVFCIQTFSLSSEMKLVCHSGETAERTYIDVTKPFNDSYLSTENEAIQKPYNSLLNSTHVVTARSRLTSVEMEMYDYIISLAPNGINTSKSDKTISHSIDVYYTAAEYASAFDIQHVADALFYDFPEIFWLRIWSQYWTSGGKIVQIDIFPYVDETYTAATNSDLSDVSSLYTRMMDVVHNTKFTYTNRYELVKAIHDFICNNTVYTYSSETTWGSGAYNPVQSPLGALVFGKAVCQGYSEAFKLFCDYYNIPCVTVVGDGGSPGDYGAHMWNAVKMDDGNWYLLDATWNDQTAPETSNRIFYDFFLVGLNTVPTYFTQIAFSLSHVSQDHEVYTYTNGTTKDGLTLPYPSFASEKCALTATYYSAFAANQNVSVKASLKILYASAVNNYDAIYYNGLAVDLSSRATGTPFYIPSGTNAANVKWILISLGDADSDGDCDIQDYSTVVNKALGEGTVLSYADKAADINRDGVIDVLDAMIYEQCAVGSKTSIVLS